MRPIPPQAAAQHGVFTVAQACAAGWTRSAVRHAVAGGELTALRRGILAITPDSDRFWQQRRDRHRQHTVAALLAYPAAYASHCSSALLVDLPVLEVPTKPCLTAEPSHSGDVPGVHLHRAAIHQRDRGGLGPLRVTMPPRTVVDVARELGVAAGLVVADAALRRGLVSTAALAEAVGRAGGRPGIAAARTVSQLADHRAESPLESVSRLAIRDAGLPGPWLQPDVYVAGRFVGRPDFYWDDAGLVGEADGWEKYEAGWQRLRDEKRRQERLERAGLIVVRWGWDDMAEFAAVATRLRGALARGSPRAPADRRWVARPSPLAA